ncbi:globin, protozoan/cyanobacterial family [Leptospira fainei serovar Hurstbridge str. BUT 6]|uniref:Globin, protozoan/cyanobacterial family n=1 Tax=Leptospira fainei serovar Hurstbridge str. BUT 6 TaxID=1193011 RepID=S3W1F8_9LEPT|nr:group II truncated hemoglobin [Leptospira fainei]EPG74132.1 globin, protozoan/cyanobacterial family [Leptospira fainei serovar Hurstbridge str. BUT 6]
MNEKKKIPSLYEWAGGLPAFEKLTKLFYQKVLQDDLLEPVFKHMSPEHQQRVAHFIAEVFGGPKIYSSKEGSHYEMIQKHLSKRLTEDQRKQWIRLLLETADEIDLPSDPEFRSAFVAYIEWGTRIAVNNSNTDELLMNPNEPMPKWGWGEPGGPYLPE